MEYVTPFFMCAIFLFGCFLLCKLILFLHDILTKRSLLRAPCLGKDASAALLSLYFGNRTLLLSRFFPYRGEYATKYREIPCILILGRKIFVLEFCSVSGSIHNTNEESWTVTLLKKRGKKKEIRIPNPVLQAEEKAELLRTLLATVKPPAPLSVEGIAVITAKKHRLDFPETEGLMLLPDALKYLRSRVPKQKISSEELSFREAWAQKKKFRKYIFKETALFIGFLRRYSLTARQAMAKNASPRRKKK